MKMGGHRGWPGENHAKKKASHRGHRGHGGGIGLAERCLGTGGELAKGFLVDTWLAIEGLIHPAQVTISN
jgi:hypothetical protein